MSERNIPGIGDKPLSELGTISVASNAALAKAGLDRVQWQHSYIVGDKTYCIYLAESEEAIREHAANGGFPADSIQEVKQVIDPTTAAFCPCAAAGNGAEA
ncbi:hypothetical protein ABPG75_010074 [Micractinium tetrahymenae]